MTPCDTPTLEIAILCGGNSRRMGADKAYLTWQQATFVELLAQRLSVCGKVTLCTGTHRMLLPDFPAVADEISGCGPIGGLCAALRACHAPLLFAVACDMPFVTEAMVKRLLCAIPPQMQVAVPVTEDGRLHPLCALYRKDAYAVFRGQLDCGDYKLRSALSALSTLQVPFAPEDSLTRQLFNVNTPEDYQRLSQYAPGE